MKMPLKVVDMDEYIENPDKEKAPNVEAIDGGMKFEVTDTESDKKYTLDADGLKGGDYHQIIRASDGTIPEEDIKRYYEAAMAIKTFYIESDEPRDLGDEIKHDWIQEIWDQVNPGLKLIRHYLNGHHKHQSGGIHMDGWTGNQYTVIVMDDRNCVASAFWNLDSITNTMTPAGVTMTIVDASCFGAYNGSVIINSVVGGVSPYTYQWTPAVGTGNTISSLYAGIPIVIFISIPFSI